MSKSFAEFVTSTSDVDIPLLRELLSIDMLIPESTAFSRGQCGTLQFAIAPGPLHWSRQVEWPWVLRNGKFRRGNYVLEVGGSYTCLPIVMAKRVRGDGKVIVVDLDAEAMEKAGHNTDSILMGMMSDISWVFYGAMDARKLTLPDDAYDRVVCVSTLEHIEGKEGRAKAIDEMVRVLKPGGLLLLTFDVFLKPNEGELDECEMHAILERLGIDPATMNGKEVHVGDVNGKPVMVCMVRWEKPK